MSSSNNLFSILYIPSEQKFKKFTAASQAIAFYKNHRLNLLDGTKQAGGSPELWFLLSKTSLAQENKTSKFIHLSYEFGLPEELQKELSADTLMGIYLEYTESETWWPEDGPFSFQKENLSIPKKTVYKEKFLKVQKHLERGDSYQVNLTMPFSLGLSNFTNSEKLISQVWRKEENRGAYAHASSIPFLNLLFLSNSPECLFEIKNDVIRTMPIKGTIRSDKEQAWELLKKNPKDQAELYMISDLLRNDLNLIQGGEAKVLRKKQKLKVHGLIHQFSLIEKRLAKGLSLKDILVKMYPGGSITGAPKKRTMEILWEVENRQRGFYTGSTIVFDGNLRAGSINIRSASINTADKKLSYSAGGGITLLSDCDSEYDEMLAKWESFKNLL